MAFFAKLGLFFAALLLPCAVLAQNAGNVLIAHPFLGNGAAYSPINGPQKPENGAKASHIMDVTNPQFSWHYDNVLKFFGIDNIADVNAEKKAYRRIAVKWHPDHRGDANVFQKSSAMHEFFELARSEPRFLEYYKAISESDPEFFIDHLPTKDLERDYAQYKAAKEGRTYDPLDEWLRQWRESEAKFNQGLNNAMNGIGVVPQGGNNFYDPASGRYFYFWYGQIYDVTQSFLWALQNMMSLSQMITANAAVAVLSKGLQEVVKTASTWTPINKMYLTLAMLGATYLVRL